MPADDITVVGHERVRPAPDAPPAAEQTLLLSLLDATTANFALTSAVWLFERPAAMAADAVPAHLRRALARTLAAYGPWCGRLEAVGVTGAPAPEAFPPHGRRYGRVYVRYGGRATTAGVDFATATSRLTLDDLHARGRPRDQPLWERGRDDDDDVLARFANDCAIGHALQPDGSADGLPLVGLQCTTLACGGVVLAAKAAHPLADISALVAFMGDWARASRGEDQGDCVPSPLFAPSRLDAVAAGDINAAQPDPALVRQAHALPMHRYDWWAAPGQPPMTALAADDAAARMPAGRPMPWAEWDTAAPVATYTVHLTCGQVQALWEGAVATDTEAHVTKHDAVLAHVVSCVMRARGLAADPDPVHCDLVLGLRAGLRLGAAFMGSPIVLLDVALPGREAAAAAADLAPIAGRVRATLARGGHPDSIAAHLHALAFESAPQRLWQAFLGRRHVLATTWARAGLYDAAALDFGLGGGGLRFADGLVPRLDGMVLIKEGPPAEGSGGFASAARPAWMADGVDVTVSLRTEAMARLLADPLLLPRV